MAPRKSAFLGDVPGMYYDVERSRYFPLRNEAIGMKERPVCSHKRKQVQPWDVNESRGARRRVLRALGPRSDALDRKRTADRVASATLYGIAGLCDCHGKKFTSVKSIGPSGLAVTTDRGQVIISCPDGDAFSFSACTETLLGVHCNAARGTWICVANGNAPHVHSWRRDPLDLVHVPPEQWTLDLPQRDIYAMSSFDNITSLGVPFSMNIVTTSNDKLLLSSRRLASDPYRLHQTSTDLVFAGLRNGSIVVDDLRTPQNKTLTVGMMPTRRLITGLRRLDDAAVPYGLAAAGLDSQLVLFDVRFSSRPLRVFEGHVNPSIPTLGFATSPDDTVVFASGSDHRLRAWDTVTGEMLQARDSDRKNALAYNFKHLVEHIDVSPNLTVRAASADDIVRFEHRGKPREIQRWGGGNEDIVMS
ncbi:hypothetical protein CspeluHIS016_0601830 [Cutaneotrichosporon spelunceum]|uniref:WD40 repeat-like protein n=1 Tax=Cutaneotrichosporon spelunceum TaxID=1672016 RepID=A0AAD3TY92_9TREE|nr:hypothetical protein CspeluHIS016_0601830 [Cutaneotrichosporon spelunceum]